MEKSPLHEFTNLVIYDGKCRFCSWSVRFLLSIDKKKILKFTTLMPEKNQNSGITQESILYIENNHLYAQSEAVIRILNRVGGLWKMALVFLAIPPGIRDFFYRLMAKNRYRIFGIQENCELPDPENADRFIPELPEAELLALKSKGKTV